jgi:hypothetical protein
MPTFSNINGWKYLADQLNTYLDQPDGTVSGTGVTASQKVVAPQYATFTFANTSVTTTDNTTAGAQGSVKFFTFPAGNIVIHGATTDLTIARVGTNITATAAVVGSVGTVAASNADSSLTSTEANVVPSTTSTLTAGAGVTKGESTAAVTIDGTSTNGELYLNFAIPDAGSAGNDALLVNGKIVVMFTNVGDN